MRPAFFKNQWYPGNPDECRRAMDSFAQNTSPRAGTWKTLVAPHAGWTFSGDAMGQGYRWLAESNPDADLVVVFGGHRGPYGPNTVFCGDAWETPVGNLITALPIAQELKAELGIASEPEKPGRPDNGAELHMPFVKHFFAQAELLMLGVAASEDALGIGEAVAELCRTHRRKAVFIGSTDLTHYGPNYNFTPEGTGSPSQQWVREINDRGFIDAMLANQPSQALKHSQDHLSACSPGAAIASWQAAQRPGEITQGHEITHYLSSDVMPSDSFVGYCSLVF
ncbi:MAG: AmmeMemoRadiSam system protein B [Deltaproteobacteria bacterium]|nr:AmmeMemoRadiSam system protein B [Deltaproteobacteria bacterium]